MTLSSPRVMAAFRVGDDPASTQMMLILGDEHGHSTVYLDAQDIADWLAEHHPQLATNIDLDNMPPEILAPCLTYARRKRGERLGATLAGCELGVLVDFEQSPYARYAQSNCWRHPVK